MQEWPRFCARFRGSSRCATRCEQALLAVAAMPPPAAHGGSYAALLLAAVADASAAAPAPAPAALPYPSPAPIPPSRLPPPQTAPVAAEGAAAASGEDVVDLTLEYGNDFGASAGGAGRAAAGDPESTPAAADASPGARPRRARGKAAATTPAATAAAAAAAAVSAAPATTAAARRGAGGYGAPAPAWAASAASAGYGYGLAAGCGGDADAPAGAPAGKAPKATKAGRAGAKGAAGAAGGKWARAATADTKAAIPPAAKRSRKAGKGDGAGGGGGCAEKRATRYRPVPSQAMQERLSRAFVHRLFLVGVETPSSAAADGGDEARVYSVLGSTANVYTVTIRERPSCTCPDHIKRGDPCKHILFVMHRVLKVERTDPCLWQTSLLPSELARIFGAAPRNGEGGGLLASPAVRASYTATMGEEPATATEPDAAGTIGGVAAADGRRPLSDDDDCPICCEEMGAGDPGATDWCRSCKNNVHTQCIGKWLGVKAAAGEPATCPMCRAGWHTGGGGRRGGGAGARVAAGPARPEGGYVNLASVSEAHAQPLSLAERYPRTSRFMSDGWRSRRGLHLVRDDDED